MASPSTWTPTRPPSSSWDTTTPRRPLSSGRALSEWTVHDVPGESIDGARESVQEPAVHGRRTGARLPGDLWLEHAVRANRARVQRASHAMVAASGTARLLVASLIISALMVVFRPSSPTPARRVELVRSAAGQRSWQARWPVSAPREHANASSSTPAHRPGSAAANGPSDDARGSTEARGASQGALPHASTPPAIAARAPSVAAAASSYESTYQSTEARRAVALALAEPVPEKGDGRRGGLDHQENMVRVAL